MVTADTGPMTCIFFFSSRRRHTRFSRDWSSDVCSSDLEKLAAGNLKSLIGFDETELDDTGNIELRCWACAAGALGELLKIGRASCRERVEIFVAGVSLRKMSYAYEDEGV